MLSTSRWGALLCAITVLVPGLALALETTLSAPGASDDLTERLRGASSAVAAQAHGLDSGQEILAASLSDYRTLVQIL